MINGTSSVVPTPHGECSVKLFRPSLPQATRATPAQIAMHNHYRHQLGEHMVRNLDGVRPIEIAVTGVVLLIALWFYTH